MKKILPIILISLCLAGSVKAVTITPVFGGGTGFGSYTSGDLIYAGSATSFTKINIGGSGTCLTSNGSIPSWGACASSGSGGGTWATTTSQVSGQFINYSLNDTDVVSIGANSSTTAEVFFDPNSNFAKIFNQFFQLSSTTLQAFTATKGTIGSATSTNLYWNNALASASTTLQNFTGINATTSQATTTNIAVSSLSPDQLVASNKSGGLVSTSTIGNNQLQNSTISGKALGTNLGALTNGATLLGSSFNGSGDISDWDIDLAHSNAWTALQTFTNATATNFSSTVASTSAFELSGAASGCATFSSTGWLSSTGVACGSGASLPYLFPLLTNGTSSLVGLYGGFISSASSSLISFNAVNGTTTTATSTTFVLPSLATAAGTFLAVNSNGTVIATSTPIGGSAAGSQAVTWATTGVLAGTPTYGNGSSGVGATLTEIGAGALSVDGNSPAANDRVLVKNEASALTNGIYTVTAAGSGIASYLLTRVGDYDQPTEIIPGIVTYVISGTANADSFWAMTSSAPITVGTTALNYTEVSAGGAAVTSVTGTSRQITASPTSGAVVLTIPSPFQFGLGSTTVLDIGNAFFGKTATSSFNGAGNLFVVGSTTLQNFTASNATTTNATTTSLAVTNLSSKILYANDTGAIQALGIGSNLTLTNGTLSATGGGAGSSGGTWSTTTSQVSGQFINYPNNDTDVVTVGANASTSAEFFFDPNTQKSKIGTIFSDGVNGSTTLQNFTFRNATSSGTIYSNGQWDHFGPASCGTGGVSFPGLIGIEVCGSDNTTGGGVQIIGDNTNSGANAWSGMDLINNLGDLTLTHYYGMFYNSSNYTDTSFGTGIAVKSLGYLQNSDGMLALISSSSTEALNPQGIEFLTGGSATDNIRMKIDINGKVGIGSTSPTGLLSLVAATGTAPWFSIGSTTNTNVSFGANPQGVNMTVATFGSTTPSSPAFSEFAIHRNTITTSNPFQKYLLDISSTTNTLLTTPVFRINQVGQFYASSTAPTIACAGTGTITGGNTVGSFTTGTTAGSSCKITFTNAWDVAPICMVTNLGQTSSGARSWLSFSATTTTTTLNVMPIATTTGAVGVTPNMANSTIGYWCFAVTTN